MNPRVPVTGLLLALCLGAVWWTRVQRQEVASLRAEQQRLLAEVESSQAAAAEIATARTQAVATQTGPPIELLELRGEITRLMGRQRELAAARGENEQLRAQLAAKRTNSKAAPTLPAGYILKSKAQWKGFNAPEDTLQSFLWAAQNRDLTNLLQPFTPEMAQQVMAESQRGARPLEDFFKDVEAFPGMRVVGRTQESADRIVLQVEIVPGMDKPEPIRLRLVNGQWKMEMK